jgi:predicted transcriptional regulator
MSEKKIHNLSAGNFEIMKLVWEKGEVTVKDVFEAINQVRDDQIGISSVKVQMNRLVKYGWLKRQKKEKNFYYSALHGKDKAVGAMVGDLKARAFNGSNLNMVKYLLKDTTLIKEEIAGLRSLLDNYDKE